MLTDLTATEAAASIRAREFSSMELVEALLDRIDASDFSLNAWEMLDVDGARAAARSCDLRLQASGATGRFFGVPFGVKDVIDVAGIPTKAGFEPFASRVPQLDATVVASLKAEGGIVLGKTVTAQLAYGDPPRTRNPWSADRTPGGSSSGSAAAVAARHVPLALSTQTGGSTLRPASFTGCVGFKPTFGLIETKGVLPMAWSLDHIGAIARSVEDCELFLDSTTRLPRSRLGRSPRLGCVSAAMAMASDDVRVVVEGAIERFAHAGAAIAEVKIEVALEEVWAIHQIIMQCEATAAHQDMLYKHPQNYEMRLRNFLEVGRGVSAADYIQAQRLRRRTILALAHTAEEADALVLPTTSTAPPDRKSTGDSTLQAIFSLAGMPAVSLPAGLSAEGLPIGIQLAAGRGQDRELLDVARWCSQSLEVCPPPPSLK